MARRSSKEAIFDALERVLCRQGLAATTMEAVAAEAGLSKGGVFYHFSSKKDMLFQLMERYERRFKEHREQIMAELPESPSRLLKATIIASVDHPARKHQKIGNIVALLDDAELREKIQYLKKKIYDEITAEYEHPERVALAILATDGLWVADMFGKPMFTESFKQRIVRELLAIIDEVAGGAANKGSAGTKKSKP